MNTELHRTAVTARSSLCCSLCLSRASEGEAFGCITLMFCGAMCDTLVCRACLCDGILTFVYHCLECVAGGGVDDEEAYRWACDVAADPFGHSLKEVGAAGRYLDRYSAAGQPAGSLGVLDEDDLLDDAPPCPPLCRVIMDDFSSPKGADDGDVASAAGDGDAPCEQ